MENSANHTVMPMVKIIPDNPYLRLNTDVHELVLSIKNIGLINPLTVNTDGMLLAGGRRYHACRLLGLEEVPVLVVHHAEMEQELISIDENIVRRPLDKLEFEKCLNRGREIHETINPEAPKILSEDSEQESLSVNEEESEEEQDENKRSYANLTAEKTGLSTNVIKSAIKRDAFSSEKLKQARVHGGVSASQANEIIRLNSIEQDEILPHVKGKTVKEIRNLIDEIKTEGLASAIHNEEKRITLPSELKLLLKTAQKLKKVISKVVIEEIVSEAQEADQIDQELALIKDHIQNYFNLKDSRESFQNIHQQIGSIENDSDENQSSLQ